jgi:hypothetical protein
MSDFTTYEHDRRNTEICIVPYRLGKIVQVTEQSYGQYKKPAGTFGTLFGRLGDPQPVLKTVLLWTVSNANETPIIRFTPQEQ